MADITEAVTVDRTADEIWQVLADFAGISRWAPNVDHSSLTTIQAEGIGAVRRVQVGRNGLLERVVQWEPEHMLSYQIDGLPPVIKSVTNTWQLTGQGGSTSVSLTSSVNAGPRPPQQLVARVAARALAKASRQMLDGLKQHLEEVSP